MFCHGPVAPQASKPLRCRPFRHPRPPLSSPRTRLPPRRRGIRGPSLIRATAAAGAEQVEPPEPAPGPDPKLPREPRLGPGSSPGRRVGTCGAIPEERPGDPLRRVMRCHVLSCAPGAAPLSGRPVGLLLCASCMRFLLRVSFHPRSRPPGRGANPVSRVSRVRLRPGPGARFAAARFARLIARARVRRRAHLSRRFLGVLFSRRRETEREAAPRGCRLPFLTHCSTPS